MFIYFGGYLEEVPVLLGLQLVYLLECIIQPLFQRLYGLLVGLDDDLLKLRVPLFLYDINHKY